jgi:thiol:disulfide interchange protein DsbA
MHSTLSRVLFSALGLGLLLGAPLARAQQWVEGKDYFLIQPAQRPSTPAGVAEVTEVFSYACTFCNRAVPVMNRLKDSLPSNAQMTFLPAAFNAAESWPMFQRVYYTAVALGQMPKMHDAIYSGIWTSQELAVTEPGGQKLKSPQPTLEDAARFFQKKAGIKPEQFLATAKSFSVDANCRRADAMVKAYRIEGTPTVIVNGHYKITGAVLGKQDELIELVKYLVAKEAG